MDVQHKSLTHDTTMGDSSSKIKREAVQEFTDKYNMGPEAVEALFEKFKGVDEDGSGTISVDEFFQTLSLDDTEENRAYATQLFAMFDENESGSIDFREFVILLSNFSSSGNLEEKKAFAFNLYDYNGDGVIDREEFNGILKATLSLSEKQIEAKAAEVFGEADTDANGGLSYEEFVRLSEKYPEYLDKPFDAIFGTHFYA
eukprot:TRINITY_DN1357_c0_g1_i12.p2 TRINITY_DN1357_c0_g1~~TRINITY_DN1357_c0_g1_i12.p2  ORF type:complete len:201 (-),score=78.92 TRINITY_DN1357_c0_g1_i12:1460-2062(-)